MRFLLTVWPLRAARCAGNALRNAATRFSAPADRAETPNGPMTQAQIPRAMRLHARSRRVNILNSLPLRVSEIDVIFPPRLSTTQDAAAARSRR